MVVLSNVSYVELVEKVVKKIRLCGGERAAVEPESVVLKYKDEDGDDVSIKTQEDVVLAFESARTVNPAGTGAGGPAQQSVFLTATVKGSV